MDEEEAYDLARITMDLHGLAHWDIKFDNAKGRLGQCKYGEQTLKFSRVFLRANSAQVFSDTLLHEIAHALVGPSAVAHGEVWKQQAMRLGLPDPEAHAHEVEFPDEEYRYEGTCEGEHERNDCFRRHRLNRKTTYRCQSCGNKIKWYDRKLGDEF